MIALPIALEFPKKKASFTFEPILQIDLVSPAPLQLTKFDSLRLHQALVNTSESSEALDLCMTAMVAKGWVTYSPNLHKWEWHVPNDYPKAVADMLYRKGLIDSKQAFISVCISQTGTPMNPKSTNITEGNNVQKLVMDLLNPILRCSSSSSSDNLNLLLPKHLRLCTRDRITPTHNSRTLRFFFTTLAMASTPNPHFLI